jgi:hypothetical protein
MTLSRRIADAVFVSVRKIRAIGRAGFVGNGCLIGVRIGGHRGHHDDHRRDHDNQRSFLHRSFSKDFMV